MSCQVDGHVNSNGSLPHSRLVRVVWLTVVCMSLVAFLPLFGATLILYALKFAFPPQIYSSTMMFLFDFVHKKLSKHQPDEPPKRNSLEVIGQTAKKLSSTKTFKFEDIIPLVNATYSTLMCDELTEHFTAAELTQWNLLTRTDMHIQCTSFPVMVIWFFGLIMRYTVILPVRICYLITSVFWIFVTGVITKIIPQSKFRRAFYEWTYVYGMDLAVCSFAYVNYHNEEYMPVNGSISVTNHTSPLDALILSRKQPFSLTGQKFNDVFAYVQIWLAECGDHIWFDRFVMEDRRKVVKIMQAHTNDKTKYPILIFPEGTCISNGATTKFRKGPFEVPNVSIYPASIVYDARFADPFWNSSQFSLFHFICRLITSWGLFCDVYYLPPQQCEPGETSIEFTKRVKGLISQTGGFIDLDWDGQLKRQPPPDTFKAQNQKEFSDLLLEKAGISNSESTCTA